MSTPQEPTEEQLLEALRRVKVDDVVLQTIATLQHPHILGLIDSGESNGTAYYVMPFVAGESLRDRLQREKQLPIADAIRPFTKKAFFIRGGGHQEGLFSTVAELLATGAHDSATSDEPLSRYVTTIVKGVETR